MYVCHDVPERFFNWGSDEAKNPKTVKRQFIVQFICRLYKRVKITSEPLRWRTSYPKGWGRQNRQFVEGTDGTFYHSVLPEHGGEVKGKEDPYNHHHTNHTQASERAQKKTLTKLQGQFSGYQNHFWGNNIWKENYFPLIDQKNNTKADILWKSQNHL